MEQNTQKEKELLFLPKEQNVSKYWKYVSIILGVVLLLLWLGGKFPVIEFKWIIVLGLGFLVYQIYMQYLLEKKQPSFERMVEIAKERARKDGTFLNDSYKNVFCEPLGNDYFALRFVSDQVTFLIYKNILMGISTKEIHELQEDNDKSSVRKILAEKGITESLDM